MSWPTSQDYNEAIQSPKLTLADPDLRAGHAVVNGLGIPMPRSGNFADVYEFHSPAGRWALKCFTRKMPGLRERYRRISTYLRRAALKFTVDFDYLEKGIRIRGDWYPILKMPWVEGKLLNEFVRENLDRPQLLNGLLAIWIRMAQRLRESGIAHADLQHGNVILVQKDRTHRGNAVAVKLIDYDGMYVPDAADVPSEEVGHSSYQHPARIHDGLYGPEVDRFPLLVVACALRALAVAGPAFWRAYDNGDNMLFRDADLRSPGQSSLFRDLWSLPDASVQNLVGYLTIASALPLNQGPYLEQIFRGSETVPLTIPQIVWLSQLLGPAGALPGTQSAAAELATPPTSDSAIPENSSTSDGVPHRMLVSLSNLDWASFEYPSSRSDDDSGEDLPVPITKRRGRIWLSLGIAGTAIPALLWLETSAPDVLSWFLQALLGLLAISIAVLFVRSELKKGAEPVGMEVASTPPDGTSSQRRG